MYSKGLLATEGEDGLDSLRGEDYVAVNVVTSQYWARYPAIQLATDLPRKNEEAPHRPVARWMSTVKRNVIAMRATLLFRDVVDSFNCSNKLHNGVPPSENARLPVLCVSCI